MFRNIIGILVVSVWVFVCDNKSSETTETTEEPASTATLNYSIFGSYPHDIPSFT